MRGGGGPFAPAPPIPPRRRSTADAAAAVAMWEKAHAADDSDDGYGSSSSTASSSGDSGSAAALAHLRAHDVDESTSELFAARYPSVESLAHVRDEDIHALDAAHQSPQLSAAIDAAHRRSRHDALGLLLDIGLSLEEAIEISSARHASGAHRHWHRHRRCRPHFETVSADDADYFTTEGAAAASPTPIQRAATAAPYSAPQLHARGSDACGRITDNFGGDRRGAAAPRVAAAAAAAIAAAADDTTKGSEAGTAVVADAGVTAALRKCAAAAGSSAAASGGAPEDEAGSGEECFVGEWHAFCSVGKPEVPMDVIKKIIYATSLGKRRIADDRIRAACKMTITRNGRSVSNGGASAESSAARVPRSSGGNGAAGTATYAIAVDATAGVFLFTVTF